MDSEEMKEGRKVFGKLVTRLFKTHDDLIDAPKIYKDIFLQIIVRCAGENEFDGKVSCDFLYHKYGREIYLPASLVLLKAGFIDGTENQEFFLTPKTLKLIDRFEEDGLETA